MTREERKRFEEVERVVNEIKKMFGLRDKKVQSIFYLLTTIEKQEASNIELNEQLLKEKEQYTACTKAREELSSYLTKHYPNILDEIIEYNKSKASEKLNAPDVGVPAAIKGEQQETPT